ncbi:MAG TPA: EamA family transporter RarD [Fibrobacteria bacterium]|nr:EamA family transporter RarD [Fibrobacteria bacterium]
MIPAKPPESRHGILYALGAYVLWGLLPIYWKALHGIPLGEVLAHRVLWSVVTILLLLAALGQLPDFLRVLADRRKRMLLGLSAVLIGCNWSIYILAVYRGELVQASLGYYINPLMSVGMGVAILREKLSPMQILAVFLAGLGVVILGLHHDGLPWVALGLAVSFALYGYVKKRLGVDSLIGLGIETLWLAPAAAAYLAWLAWRHAPQTFAAGAGSSALLVGAGAVTLAPLFFFNGAARRLPLSTLGFYQYLSPSIQLAIAVLWFHEPFTRMHAMSFGLIWAALALYTADAFRRSGRE